MWTNKHFKTPNLSRRHFILLVWLLLWEEHESLIVVRQGGTGDQGQAMLLCLVSEDGDLSSSGSSISDEDRSRRRTNQRLIITIQMNVHSCIFSLYSARAPMLHAAVLRRAAARYLLNSLQPPGGQYSHVEGTCLLEHVSRGGVGVATCCDVVTLSLQSLRVTPGWCWCASPC